MNFKQEAPLGSYRPHKLTVGKQSLSWVLDHHSYYPLFSAQTVYWTKGTGHANTLRTVDPGWMSDGWMSSKMWNHLVSSSLHQVYQRAQAITLPSLSAPHLLLPSAWTILGLFLVTPLVIYFIFLLSFYNASLYCQSLFSEWHCLMFTYLTLPSGPAHLMGTAIFSHLLSMWLGPGTPLGCSVSWFSVLCAPTLFTSLPICCLLFLAHVVENKVIDSPRVFMAHLYLPEKDWITLSLNPSSKILRQKLGVAMGTKCIVLGQWGCVT